ncbi:RIP metalloprotease RseP [Mycoplasma sp. P36-A1]|uniref:RIP metalloprotease RseP n=1 Tax=Mycoplasma sp. P36-A1 TaxID=3252900 RepID=UPI003C2E05FD
MEILKFLVILLVLVSVHEFGHFIAAKIFNVYVSEFALGFGPKIFSHKGKETEFSIRMLPLGGFAAMAGEDVDQDEQLAHLNLPVERTLKGVNRLKQFIIMFAGAFMNIVLAFIIFCGIAATQDTINPQPIIGVVSNDSPAAKAGLKTGDLVTSIEQDKHTTKITTYSDLSIFTSLNKEGQAYTMNVLRDNKNVSLDIKPAYVKEEERYIAGFSPSVLAASKNPKDIIVNGFNMSVDGAKSIFTSLKMLFTGKAGVNDLSGPVGMIEMTKDIDSSSGIVGLINFTALLSMNLAIFNLLPIPALDGGRILILIIEAVTRRKFSSELESRIIGVSFALLMALIVFVTFNDILKIFNG